MHDDKPTGYRTVEEHALVLQEQLEAVTKERDEVSMRLGQVLVECDRLTRSTSAARVRNLEAALESVLRIRNRHEHQGPQEQAIYRTAQMILDGKE